MSPFPLRKQLPLLFVELFPLSERVVDQLPQSQVGLFLCFHNYFLFLYLSQNSTLLFSGCVEQFLFWQFTSKHFAHWGSAQMHFRASFFVSSCWFSSVFGIIFFALTASNPLACTKASKEHLYLWGHALGHIKLRILHSLEVDYISDKCPELPRDSRYLFCRMRSDDRRFYPVLMFSCANCMFNHSYVPAFFCSTRSFKNIALFSIFISK